MADIRLKVPLQKLAEHVGRGNPPDAFCKMSAPKFLEGADIIRAWGEIRLGCPAPESASIVLFSGHRKIPIIRFERILGIYTQHFYRMF